VAGRFILEDENQPDAEPVTGRFVLEPDPAPTAPYRNPRSLSGATIETQVRGAPRQTVAPRPTGGNWAQQLSRAVSGEGQRQENVAEVGAILDPRAWIPENPEIKNPVLRWWDAQRATNAVGLGFFLNPNEQSRAQIIQRNIPTSQFRRDEYGNLQVRYRPDRPWLYINRPGLSGEDAQTFANETTKYVAASRIPGLRATGAEGVIAGTVRAGATGAVTSAAGQGASLPLGADEVNAGDVAVSGVGAMGGNLIGHGIVGLAKTAPQIVRTGARELSDRLPGGVQRAAERAASATRAQVAAETLARDHAEAAVRAQAQQLNLAGEALEGAVRQAQDDAVAVVQAQWRPGQATELDKLAKSFGVQLARAQTKGDTEAMRFMYEAAGGLHGPGAQRAAAAFLEAQNRALPEGIRAIAGDASVTSAPAAVNTVRTAMERAASAGREAENAAWGEFDRAVPNVRTYDVTPKGKPGAARFVRDRLQGLLVQDKKMVQPQGVAGEPKPPAAMLPEFEATYPRVARIMSLANRMATGTKAEMPMRDVDRVIQLKRFIDAQWEEAATDAERRIITMMGTEVRNWLKETGGGYVAAAEGGAKAAGNLGARGAGKTSDALQGALQISAQNAKQFRENTIVRDMLDTRLAQTDQEVARRIFGGGEGGLNVSSEGVKALSAIKEVVGPSSPAWEAMRQAALRRLTRGLDDALATNQTPAIITTHKRIAEALRNNREAMQLLFTPDELARLTQAQRVLAAMAPTPRNPANPTNSGITAGRAQQNAINMLMSMLKQVPGANIAIGAVDDVAAAARVTAETRGAQPQASSEISDALREFWFGPQTRLSGVGSAVATDALNDPMDEEPVY